MSERSYYGIIGAGGHGRETLPLARESLAARLAAGEAELLFVAEGDFPPARVNGHRLIPLEQFKALPGARYFNVAIGNSRVRERIAGNCLAAGLQPFSIKAANALILDGTLIGDGYILSPFSAVTANVVIGRHFHANNFCNIAHDCVIGDFVTFAPGVKCNGHVHIGDHAYLGSGALIRNGSADRPLNIGAGAVIGMGAVVVGDVPPGATVVGNPARLLVPGAKAK
ncbi:MAG: acetyltransferase [Desulfuromonadales bacterium]|nr:acetyltransferase [Desulfuromonadales bacterium]